MTVFRSTPIERAFELARDGQHPTLKEIRSTLVAEGFGTFQLEGRSLRRQIRRLCMESKKIANAEDSPPAAISALPVKSE